MSETFQKTERLCSRKILTLLFEEGNIFFSPVLKSVWCINTAETKSPVQVAFSVPKKSFRRAVDRNLIKRRMREAYRRHKQKLHDSLSDTQIRIAILIIFREKNIPEYPEIEKSMTEMLDKLVPVIRKKINNC